MEINLANMVRIATIVHIVVTIVGAVGVTAGVVWVIVFIMQLLIEGLRLLQSSIAQMNALLADMPGLHFLFLWSIVCIVVMLAAWMTLKTADYVKWKIQEVTRV